MGEGTVVTVEGLEKRYGELVVLRDVSFEVRRGEIFGLLGRNGSGKTTTVECLQGLRRPDGGTMRVLGLDPRTQAVELRRHIGSQLQESSLPERIRVWEALKLFASLSPNGRPWRESLEQWGLGHKANATFASLSGGQRQALFIALALVNEPEVVFLDEMTTGLDPAARSATWDLIEAMRAHGTTVVLVTHFMDEAMRLCDRVAIIADGRVTAVETPRALIQAQAGIRVRFTVEGDLAWLDAVPDVDSFRRHGPQVEVLGRGAVVARLGHALIERGVVPDDFWVEQPTLEDAFLAMTRDGGR